MWFDPTVMRCGLAWVGSYPDASIRCVHAYPSTTSPHAINCPRNHTTNTLLSLICTPIAGVQPLGEGGRGVVHARPVYGGEHAGRLAGGLVLMFVLFCFVYGYGSTYTNTTTTNTNSSSPPSPRGRRARWRRRSRRLRTRARRGTAATSSGAFLVLFVFRVQPFPQ